MGAEQDVDLIIVVTNRPPQVVACTDHEWTGATLDQLPWPEATGALQTALTSGGTDERQVTANGDFQVTLPFVLPAGVQSGIGLQPGAVLVRIDQTSDRTQLARAIWTGTLWFVFQLLVLNALILLLIQKRVLHPLQLIVATLMCRREGDTSARVPALADDEIGAVARAMNAIFDRREELESEAVVRTKELTETNRRLSESEERFRIAAESATEFIFDWNISTGTVSWSQDIGSLLGYSPQEFPPTVEGWAQGIHPDDRPRVLAALNKHVFQGNLYDIEYRLVAKDGSHTYWRARGNTLRDSQGKPVRMIGALTNVTAERLAAQQLQVAKETAEAANRAKDEFLAALSHELRTPLSPVLMLAGEMEQCPDVPADLREGFALIRHNVELEARLIDDLLDITRITRGKFHLENEVCDLHRVLEKAVETIRPSIEARGLALHIELAAPEHQVMGDSVRLQQVFWNLLKNAAKFTPSGGRILIRSWNPDEQTICLSFTDTGMGISPENLERIFMAFEQVKHPGSHRLGGLGLGLSISRRLMEAHGGRIWAESAGSNQGTTFHVQLPLLSDTSAKRMAAEAPPAAAAPAPSVPLRILLVEDHEATRVILERLLKRRSHEVFPARDIATARQLAAENDFDLVISDIGLPDGTGYDLMSELRGKYPTLLGIALSGFGMEQDVQRSRAAGFFAHLTKPIDMKVLDRTIGSMRQQTEGNGGGS
ncbi:ATP-binding protein [Verrucomicrobiota bacterium sgz303538]